eukprot:CAMPEP_0170508966 /NCGR_PEP_ID=MMETSP0208-20121228/63974_1 /TAXON_ID=197538 /ORGANISM="Strombidium inclinatum, Strain S3" /LENGTH=53 /DNA_ID=CAMNT_0010792149 /DNA_START=54 /DNA_END=212 /DNA_ORIENTATION=-
MLTPQVQRLPSMTSQNQYRTAEKIIPLSPTSSSEPPEETKSQKALENDSLSDR